MLGLATDYLGRKTALPRVSLLFLFGFIFGPGAFGILPEQSREWMPVISNIALLFVGFLLGGKLTKTNTLENGLVVISVSVSVVLVTLLVVSGGLFLIGMPLGVALLLGGIATATDPAATLDVIEETRANGKFTDTLVGIVGIDDAWGLIVFSMMLALVKILLGAESWLPLIGYAVWEMFGAIILGLVLGIPMAYLSGRIRPGEPLMLEVAGMVLLCGGIAQYLGVSYILSSMVLGIVVTNYAKHHDRPFHEIKNVEWPFMVLFFTLTGASLSVDNISQIGGLTLAYILFRIIARYAGCWPGAHITGARRSVKLWMGGALLPQAGIATGMALLAAAQFPEYAVTIIPLVVLATVVFELVGPIFTRISLSRAGDRSKMSRD